jgi:hypothetical protein
VEFLFREMDNMTKSESMVFPILWLNEVSIIIAVLKFLISCIRLDYDFTAFVGAEQAMDTCASCFGDVNLIISCVENINCHH